MVEKFVTIEPRLVLFEGKPGDVLKSIVSIIPQKKYPFVIKKSRAKQGKWVKYDLEPWGKEKKKGYKLVVENLKKEPGIYRDAIIFETDSPIQPEIRINIMARIMEDQTDKSVNSHKHNLDEFIRKVKNEKADKTSTSENIKKPIAKSQDVRKMFEELIKKAQQKKEQEKLSN